MSITLFQVVGRKCIKNYYQKSFVEFNGCCGFCWHCVRMKTILDELVKKGFYTFNSHVNSWKYIVRMRKATDLSSPTLDWSTSSMQLHVPSLMVFSFINT